MKRSHVEVLIVGAGPAGLSAAKAIHDSNKSSIRVIERESEAGGIPRHTFHTGYGVRDFHRLMSGPKYAARYVREVESRGIEISTSTTAFDWVDDQTLAITSPKGIEEVKADRIVLATGARERGRHARQIPGTRPAGIYTTGLLQQSVFINHEKIGTRAVIVGAEHVSYSAIMTLRHAGVKIAAMVTPLANHETFGAVNLAATAIYKFPLIRKASITEIFGREQVSGVQVLQNNSNKLKETFIECDVLVFTADWIPDNELVRLKDIEINPQTKSPIVDSRGETKLAGVYAIGNLVLPIKSADQCAVQARNLFS